MQRRSCHFLAARPIASLGPALTAAARFAPDSPLEGAGFEPSVPLSVLTVSGPSLDSRKIAKPGDVVGVKVLEVDPKRRRIALTMRLDEAPEARPTTARAAIAPTGSDNLATIRPLETGSSGGGATMRIGRRVLLTSLAAVAAAWPFRRVPSAPTVGRIEPPPPAKPT